MFKIKSVWFQSAVIGSLGIIIGSIMTIIWNWYYDKISESETRIFDIKQEIYSDFLDKYYKHFNSTNIDSNYKKIYDDDFLFVMYNWAWIGGWGMPTSNREKSEDYKPLNEILNNPERVRKCYYEEPWFCEWRGNKDIGMYHVIWMHQASSFKSALKKILGDFRKDTYQAQLIMPENIYAESVNLIESIIYTAPNSFKDCDVLPGLEKSEWNSPLCWFDFGVYLDSNWEYLFFSDTIIEKLKNDLQSHY